MSGYPPWNERANGRAAAPVSRGEAPGDAP